MISKLRSKLFYNIPSEPDAALRKIEKQTFKLHVISQILMGSAIGILTMQDIILKKSLLSTDFAVAVLIFLTHSSLLFSIYGVEIVNRSNNRGRTILIIAILSRIFLFIIPFFEFPFWFILCIAAMSYMDALLKPLWNIVLKHNYGDARRSIYFSYATTAHTIFVLLSATLVGFAFDIDYKLYKFFFPLAGIMDIIVYINLAKLISLQHDKSVVNIDKFSGKIDFRLIKDITVMPLRSLKRIFSVNKEFFKFEKYFMAYGIAFMMMSTAIPIYFVEVLKLGYIPISTARGLVFHSAIILATPFIGRLFGHGNPVKFTGLVFLVLSSFPFAMLIISATDMMSVVRVEYLIYFAYFLFGISMSGVNISWNLSSIYFAPALEVQNYQAVHITLTGIRGIFSPFLGYAIMKIFSVSTVFIISGIILVVAGVLMLVERSKVSSSVKIKAR
jgi:hypothetical protein